MIRRYCFPGEWSFVSLLATALVAVVLPGAAGCGRAPSTIPGVVEVTYWRTLTGRAGKAQDELVRRFNESHPGVRVSVEFQGDYPDLATKLMTAVAGGSGPDVTQLGTFEIREFARAGLLVDLRPFLEGPDGFDTSDWPGTILSAGEVDGGLYWLPFNVTVPVLYYNQDAFREAGLPGPPRTWDAFFDAARKLTARDASGVVRRAGLALWDITWPLFSAIWSEGGELTDRDYTHITLNDPVAVAFLTRLQELVREGAAVMPDRASGGHRAAFTNGRAAMILDSPAPFEQIFAQAQRFTPGVAPYPEGRKGAVYAPGGGGIAMLARTPDTRRASTWVFMKYLLSPEQLAWYARESGYTAFTGRARAAAGDLLDDPRRAVIHNSLAYVRGDFSVNMSPAVRDAFDEAYRAIVVDLADVQSTLDAANAKAVAGVRSDTTP